MKWFIGFALVLLVVFLMYEPHPGSGVFTNYCAERSRGASGEQALRYAARLDSISPEEAYSLVRSYMRDTDTTLALCR